ncbi:DUF397 domain-containing protein [Actinomadura syzygii]|uniref:DUF397 domain-containing protein n=1 Tax=Actinomadura syzygii TaxID=1427538 RepID=A0A5D0UIH2_9ACTN|nr:DUF397 domain-containing protein [Actinomadura syzygii]TYC17442.1 DUF397 domain-containing protein [Actinomadura syzygii]
MDLTSTVWRKSTRSGNNGGNCVEIANLGDLIAMRDSKDPEGPKLILTRTHWRSLAAHLKASERDG